MQTPPLPKYPSCPVRHTRSPQPPLPPGVRPPPHNGPLSSGHSTPACPLGPQPKTAAGSESSKEESVSQPLSWPNLPSPGFSRALSRRVSGGISPRMRGAWPLRSGMKGQEESSSPNPTSRAYSAPWHWVEPSARPQRSEGVSPGEQLPSPAILRGRWARRLGAWSQSLKVSAGTVQRMTGQGPPASPLFPSPLPSRWALGPG